MQQTKNVTDLTTVELKALGFDITNESRVLNANLKVINDELERRYKEELNTLEAKPEVITDETKTSTAYIEQPK